MVLSYLFYPLSIIYTLVVTIRNKAFDYGVLHSSSHSIPTIGVGNLSAGGTGKTPHVEYLVRLLQKENYGRLALLSRGYKQHNKRQLQEQCLEHRSQQSYLLKYRHFRLLPRKNYRYDL